MCALTVIENIAENLPVAVKDGGNLAAQAKIALGNTLSGCMMVILSENKAPNVQIP